VTAHLIKHTAKHEDLFSEIRISIRHIPAKRIFDILFSLIALTILLPFFIVISLIIKFSSRGPVFYAQERVGRGGSRFKCWKFRTMHQDADRKLAALLSADSKLKREWDLFHKLKKDPRIAPFGHFLRKTSLDELPQFWNVLKGDLSVVGPRPVVPDELLKHFDHEATQKILSIRPGITCIWQVSGRNDTSYRTRVKLDKRYVETRSLFLDLKLVAKTIPSLFSTKGAY